MDERLWGILTDSFPKMLEYGIKVTVPLTVLSFALALVVALGVALIQYAGVKVLRQLCRFYILITRGTPCWCSCTSYSTACRRWESCWKLFPRRYWCWG